MAGAYRKAARIYDAAIFDYGRTPAHYWAATASDHPPLAGPPLTSDLTCDAAIIGGGYTGLSAAHQLARRHQLDVCVLDAGTTIGWGASGMNGGFVSMGGAHLGVLEMVRRAGEDETRRYWKSQVEAVELVRDLIHQSSIACDVTGDGNLCVAHNEHAAKSLQNEAEVLAGRFGLHARFMPAGQFRTEIHRGPWAFGALSMLPGFGVHPMKYVRGLARRAAEAGVRIASAAEVVSIQTEGGRRRLVTATGATVRTGKIVVATNAYMPDDLCSDLACRVLPAISSIIVTQPYPENVLEERGFRSTSPIYNSRHILSYYRRLQDGRILFGGRGDTSGTPMAAEAQSRKLLAGLKRTLPEFGDARIDDTWRGLAGLTSRRTASVGLIPGDHNIAFAFGCQGSGIATMTWAGRLAADLVAGRARESDVPALLRDLPPRLPRSAALRRWGLRAAYAGYALRDGFNV